MDCLYKDAEAKCVLQRHVIWNVIDSIVRIRENSEPVQYFFNKVHGSCELDGLETGKKQIKLKRCTDDIQQHIFFFYDLHPYKLKSS